MKKIFILIVCLFLSQCGYKVIKYNDLLNFDISDINTDGDSRINFKIKNKLNLYRNTGKENIINLNIITTKDKTIKEKNIKNEITKYQLNIKSEIEVLSFNGKRIKKFSLQESGEFSVNNQYSQTLDNEKKISNLIAKKILDQIIDNLILISNDS